MLRLHHAPLACSLAARLALIEAGLDHEVVHVHTTRGEQKAAGYLAINPRGQVPALETPDGVLTESSAILPFIADLTPEAGLMPPAGTFARAEAQAWLGHLSSSVHAAYGALLNPDLAPVHGVFREKLAKALAGGGRASRGPGLPPRPLQRLRPLPAGLRHLAHGGRPAARVPQSRRLPAADAGPARLRRDPGRGDEAARRGRLSQGWPRATVRLR